MKSHIYELTESVSIVRIDNDHTGARYLVMHKDQLTPEIKHITEEGSHDNWEDAVDQAVDLMYDTHFWFIDEKKNYDCTISINEHPTW